MGGGEPRTGEREREKVSSVRRTGAIMEPLCLVKSHEITRATAGIYSTAERGRGKGEGETRRGWRRSGSALGPVSVAAFYVYGRFGNRKRRLCR